MNKKLMMLSLFCVTSMVVAAETLGDEWKSPTHALLNSTRYLSSGERGKVKNFLRTCDEYANGNADKARTELEKVGISARIVNQANISSFHRDNIRDVQPFAVIELGEKDSNRFVYFNRNDKGAIAAIFPAMQSNVSFTLPVGYKGSLWDDKNEGYFKHTLQRKAPAWIIARRYALPLTIEELTQVCGGKAVESVPALVSEFTSEAIFAMCAKATKDSELQCAIQ